MRDKVEFIANVPVEVALEYTEGKLCDNTRYGDQYYYSLVGNRSMYVPPIVARQINELEVQRGELITIVKSVTKEPIQEGARKSRDVTRWIVRRSEDSGTLAVQKVVERAPVHGGEPARALTPETAPIQNISRRERMIALGVDAVEAAMEIARQTGRNLDSAEFQDLVSTLIIDDQKRAELDLKYFNARPSTMPNHAARPNGHANGAIQ